MKARAPIARVVSTGRFSPERVMTNAELEALVETSDEWIRTRTGIRERRIADPLTGAAEMGAAAARQAMERAGVGAEELDLVLVSTATPDRLLPSTACDIQAILGAGNAGAYDFASACSGFPYGLALAEGHIAAGHARTILLVCTEKMSSLAN
jgi:3-oxoacyl-[acyl-carrier-protein] synthase III